MLIMVSSPIPMSASVGLLNDSTERGEGGDSISTFAGIMAGIIAMGKTVSRGITSQIDSGKETLHFIGNINPTSGVDNNEVDANCGGVIIR